MSQPNQIDLLMAEVGAKYGLSDELRPDFACWREINRMIAEWLEDADDTGSV
jgi:hypothetical protein